jgi:D-cysteine desulfhydrase
MLLLSGVAIRRRRRRTSTLWSLMMAPTAELRVAYTTAFQPEPYRPPAWCGNLTGIPGSGRLNLGNFPTPLYQLFTNDSGSGGSSSQQALACRGLYVKRDDSTGGIELGGNKVRKLEFLLADALARACDCVVTIGGVQSNHCRATASAARMVGLEPHLILRQQASSKRASTSSSAGNDNDDDDGCDLGLTGNLLIDRMVGAAIYTCTAGEYGRVGSQQLVARLCKHLQDKGRNPYAIPVGGSNALGSWGYIQGVEEMLEQWSKLKNKPSLDQIVFACGSGGTAAGIALGCAMAFAQREDGSVPPTVHAIGVCDDEDYFYKFVADIAENMGILLPAGTATPEEYIRKHLIVHQGKGLGYAISTTDELDFVMRFARETGIILDPVYSGKAMYNFFEHMKAHKGEFHGTNVLFWHTGGALGLYDKCDDLLPKLKETAPCRRLDVYGKANGIDVSHDVPYSI